MFKITWRGVRQYPVRFILSTLAVVLGIAFITGTFALRTSLSTTFSDITSSSFPGDVYVQPAADAGSTGQSNISGATSAATVDMSLAKTIAAIPGVASAHPSVEGSVVLVGNDGIAVRTSGAPTLAFVLYPGDTSFSVVSGRMPERRGEIALETSALKASGLSVGDRTKLVIGTGVKDVTVVGDLKYEAAPFGAILMAIDQQTGTDAFAPGGKTQSIAVKATDQNDQSALSRTIADALGTKVTAIAKGDDGYRTTLASGAAIDVRTADSLRAETQKAIEDIIGFISVFLLIFATVALFVGGFIIANTFAMSVRQRMREIAILRAIGASRAQIFASVVGQAILVGIVGAIVGIAAGMGLIALVRQGLQSMGSQMSSDIPLTTETVVVALLAGVIVSAIAAAIPAMRAATIPPVVAMREESAREKPMFVRGTIGGVLIVLGFAAAFTAGAIGEKGGTLLGVGAAAVLIGVLFAAPVVVPWVLRVLAWPFAKLFKPMGGLALGNVTRNPRRTASTASALMIGMALVGGCAVLATSTQASMASVITTSAKSDFVLQSAQTGISGVPTDAISAIRNLPEAGRVDVLMFSALKIDGKQTYVVAGDRGLFPHSATLPMLSGSVAAPDAGEALVVKTYADDHKLKVGDTITAASVFDQGAAGQGAAGQGAAGQGAAGQGAAGQGTAGESAASQSATQPSSPASAPVSSKKVRVGGIFDDGSVIGAPVILPAATLDELVPAQARIADTVFVTAASGTTTEQLRTSLVDATKPYYVISVMDKDQWVTQMSNQINQILYILYALLGLSIVIAILGIINTLALSVIERTREIGLMRAVGLGRLQLSSTITIESVLISVFGAVLGVAVGVSLASFLPKVLAVRGFTDLAIPWAQLGWMLVLAAGVGVVAAVWPAIRAARLPVLDAISQE